MWDLPKSEMESVSPALAGRFFTTEPLGKPNNGLIKWTLWGWGGRKHVAMQQDLQRICESTGSLPSTSVKQNQGFWEGLDLRKVSNTLGLSINWNVDRYYQIHILRWEGQGSWWERGPGEGAERSDTPDWACTSCPEVRARQWHHWACCVVGWGALDATGCSVILWLPQATLLLRAPLGPFAPDWGKPAARLSPWLSAWGHTVLKVLKETEVTELSW